MRTVLAVALSLLAAEARAAEKLPPFAPIDVFGLEWAETPRVSPDGRQVVYARSFFDPQKDRKRSNLWLVDVASGERRPLTTGSVNDAGPVWSPDGKRIAYLGADGDQSQIYVRWLGSGAVARVTQVDDGPDALAWSPDGRTIAFTMRVPAQSEPLAADMPSPPEGAEWAEPVKIIDKPLYRFDGAGYVEPGYSHVFVVAADGGAARQVTSGEYDVDGPLLWTRDGTGLIASRNSGAEPDWEPLERDLYRIDVASGAMRQLTRRKGPDGAPSLSPDGKRIAYVGFDDRNRSYENARLLVVDVDGGTPRVLTEALDRSVDNPRWDGDRGIWFQYEDRGRNKLGWVAADGGAIETVADDLGGTEPGRPYTSGGFHAAGGKVAYTRGDATRLADVAVVSRGDKPRVLTEHNANLLAHRDLAQLEELTYASSADGLPIQAWVLHPPGFDAGKNYPLVLEIHGGPFAAYGPHFAPELQMYAAKGYVVLYVNPRGSTSYGERFANEIHHNYPSRDYDDLMTGVDTLLARGYIDADNLFVTGGSGGGVLTAWIVGHTDRFRAAVVAKPVINWISFVLTADAYPFFTRYWFAALPWEQPEQYLKRSPLSYVGNVKTPTMLITGESDYRTPISESEQFYQALQLRKVDTALVRIPGASHSINARPSNMIAQVLNSAAWFERHRKHPDAANPAASPAPAN